MVVLAVPALTQQRGAATPKKTKRSPATKKERWKDMASHRTPLLLLLRLPLLRAATATVVP